MNKYDKTKIYIQYCEDILTRKINSCEAVYLQCKQFKDRFNRTDMYFDYEDVDKRIRFVAKMKHSTGVHNGKPFILLPWQQFMFAGIFGWKWCDTNFRVTKKVLAFVSRKNGKTATCAALALVQESIDNEPAAEIEFVANSTKQAAIGFEHTKNFAESLDPQKLLYERYRGTIKMPSTKSVIQVLSSDSMGNDGYNAHMAILDEFHAQKDWGLYNVMVSSMGMRTQPLMVVITTAGFLLDGYPLYEMRKLCVEILKGQKQDDTQFSLIYELDEGDDWMNDESCWIKCCPSLGQTVYPQYMRDQVTTAKNSPAQLTGVLTKNFNMFCQSAEVWIPGQYIDKCIEEVNLDDYAGETCYAGIDLAAVSDLTALSICIPPNQYREKHPDKFIFKSWIFLPSSCLTENVNRERYKEWNRLGELIVNEGNVTDYDYILDKCVEVNNLIPMMSVAYDTYNATQFAINATNASLPMEPYSQALGNFNRPTKYFEMLVRQNKAVIDKSTAIRWCFNNVELMVDHNENCKPKKAGDDKSKKIDPVISMLQSLGAYLLVGGVDVTVA